MFEAVVRLTADRKLCLTGTRLLPLAFGCVAYSYNGRCNYGQEH
jgi:hypothetical protein